MLGQEKRELPFPGSESAGGRAIAIHCSGGSAAQWRGLAARLGAGWTLETPELFGCGRRGPWSGDGAFCLKREAAAVIELIDAGRGPVHLLGHSYGGMVALQAAVRRPGKMASLSLYEPTAFHLLAGFGARGRQADAEIRRLAAEVERRVLAGDYHSAARAFVSYWNGPEAWSAIRPETRAALAAWIIKAPLDFRAIFTCRVGPEALSRLAVPTLLVSGDRSPASTRVAAERLAGLLPRARRVTLEGAGHMGPISHAPRVEEIFAGQLFRLAAGRPVAEQGRQALRAA